MIAGCATQEDPEDTPGGTSGNASGGTAAAAGSAGKASGGTSTGTAGASAGSAGQGTGGTNGAGTNAGGTESGGTGGSDGAGTGGMTMGGGGASAGSGGSQAGGSAGAGGKGGSAGAGGKGGGGGTGGTAPVDACKNGKKDANETDSDCGGVCATKCATGKGCADLDDCVANNVCDAQDKCRATGCNAGTCAYLLTRYIIDSGPSKGQVIVSSSSTNLELRFEVLDNTPFDDSANNWEDDSVEIYLDLNNAKTATYQADDFQINVPRHAGNAVVGIGTNLNTAAVMVTRTNDAMGYTLIVTVPWSALDNAAHPGGKTIGFDVGVNDDKDGGTRNSQLMLTGTDTNYLNTSQFGTLAIP